MVASWAEGTFALRGYVGTTVAWRLLATVLHNPNNESDRGLVRVSDALTNR